ncbi:dipeptide epimerase [filamentous cyanobacterium LEGE 11480]|uniref:Dipeptide epimerase n=1 Tax=Romeriopsis navalis LEGE 11480 TaxID=2777977 RepID=A0A928VSG1_9CYAN|nr:dipeptide epimerase [Romeriopsis navalis]MBE9032918.1 dipeptide epimerase [Romeriopsis navalis LEGE 11480]
MQIRLQTFTVNKRFALTISRGTTAKTTNLFVRLEHDGIEGWGEASPFSIGETPQTTEALARSLQRVMPLLAPYHPLERDKVDRLLKDSQVPSAARSAIDMAMHDWLGHASGVPLWHLWGLNRENIVPTSVTIGISTPAAAQERVKNWLGMSSEIQSLKVKLGSPAGIAADQAMLQEVMETAPHIKKVSIDANGGWNLKDAVMMSYWLAEQGIDYIEQPLAKGNEDDLQKLYAVSPLPIFVDESCFTSADIPGLVDRCHGINIKLNKCGGLTEATKMIHAAKTFGLGVMFGCYSDSTLMNTALAQLAPLADHLDLDSHLNLLDDPFEGALFQNGRVVPNNNPGLGVALRAKDAAT